VLYEFTLCCRAGLGKYTGAKSRWCLMNRIVNPEDMASVQDGYETTSLPTDKQLLSFKERKSFGKCII